MLLNLFFCALLQRAVADERRKAIRSLSVALFGRAHNSFNCATAVMSLVLTWLSGPATMAKRPSLPTSKWLTRGCSSGCGRKKLGLLWVRLEPSVSVLKLWHRDLSVRKDY